MCTVQQFLVCTLNCATITTLIPEYFFIIPTAHEKETPYLLAVIPHLLIPWNHKYTLCLYGFAYPQCFI